MMASGKKSAQRAAVTKKIAKGARKGGTTPKAGKKVSKKATKPAARRATPKKAAPKKAAPKKAAPKKPAPKKAAPKKASPKKPAAKKAPKPAPKKAAPVKKAPAKPAPKKAAPAKPAAPKPAAKAAPAPAPAPKPAPKEAAPKPATQKAAPTKAAKAAPSAPAPAASAAPPQTAAQKKAAKRKPIPSVSSSATPVFRPIGSETPQMAPPPPPAKPGHVDHQVLSAITYGLFSAINKTFGFAGRSVVNNASLRMLEYGYKRGWLPPKSREPVRALNEFFGRLETMGYADKIHAGKRGEEHILEIQGLADFDALHELRSMHYPLLPFFLGEMLTAIMDQYFNLRVTMGQMEIHEQKRGVSIPFQLHEKPTAVVPSTIVSPTYRLDEFEE